MTENFPETNFPGSSVGASGFYSTSKTFLQRVKSGDESAWNDFFYRYAGMICSIGKKKNLTPEECDELLVEVMVTFWKKLDGFIYDPARGRFRHYLSSIAGFWALKMLNMRSKEAATDIPEEVVYPDGIDEKYMQDWQDFILARALEDLQKSMDTETFQIFYMSTFQKRPVSEVVAVTRRTAGNIYTIRSRGCKKLRELIAAYRESSDAELQRYSKSSISAL